MSPAAMSRAILRRSRLAVANSSASDGSTRGAGRAAAVASVRSNSDPAGSTCSTTPEARIGRCSRASWAFVTMWVPSIRVTEPRPTTRRMSAVVGPADHGRGVLVDAHARAAAGSARRSSAAGRSGCAGRSAGRSRSSRTSPSPAATWVIRCLGVEPPGPKATMCEDWMLAPAEVPPMVTPRSRASTMASPERRCRRSRWRASAGCRRS